MMSQNRHIRPSAEPFVPIHLESPVLGVAEDRASGDLIPRHHHDVAQLIHASSGVLTIETDDGNWVIPPARAVWVPAGVTHSIAMSGRAELRTLYIADGWTPITDPTCSAVQVTPLLHHTILRIVDFVQPYPADGAEARIAGVALDEIRSADIAPLHLPMPTDPRARTVAKEFLQEPSDRRAAKDWAKTCGASERTLERIFVREAGTTFGRWQQQARLLEALRLLGAGIDVTNVALRVGYDSPSAFIAMFARAMGTTPGRYFTG